MRGAVRGVGLWGIVGRSVRLRGGRSIRGSVGGGRSRRSRRRRRREARRWGCRMRRFEVRGSWDWMLWYEKSIILLHSEMDLGRQH